MKSKYQLEFNYEFIPAIMSCQFQLHFTASLVLTLNISFQQHSIITLQLSMIEIIVNFSFACQVQDFAKITPKLSLP